MKVRVYSFDGLHIVKDFEHEHIFQACAQSAQRAGIRRHARAVFSTKEEENREFLS